MARKHLAEFTPTHPGAAPRAGAGVDRGRIVQACVAIIRPIADHILNTLGDVRRQHHFLLMEFRNLRPSSTPANHHATSGRRHNAASSIGEAKGTRLEVNGGEQKVFGRGGSANGGDNSAA